MTANVDNHKGAKPIAPRLSEIDMDATASKRLKDDYEEYWSKMPDVFRCLRISEEIDAYMLRDSYILDVGCGDTGNNPAGALKEGYIGLDLSLTACKKAQTANPEANFINADMRHIPLRDGAVRLAYALRCLHSVNAGMYRALSELARVASVGIAFEAEHVDRLEGPSGVPLRCGIENLDFCVGVAPIEDGRVNLEGYESFFFFDDDGVKRLAHHLGFTEVGVVKFRSEGRQDGRKMLSIIPETDKDSKADSMQIRALRKNDEMCL